MRVSLIVALAEGGVIGRAGGLPWRLPADLARFKRLTMDHHVVMGRKTFESIGRPLPGRTMVVLTRQTAFAAEGVRTAESLDAALARIAGDDEVFIIGGAEVYRAALPRASRMYVTHVLASVEGDTFFPELDWDQWRLTEEEFRPADEKNAHDCRFCVYDRIWRASSAAE